MRPNSPPAMLGEGRVSTSSLVATKGMKQWRFLNQHQQDRAQLAHVLAALFDPLHVSFEPGGPNGSPHVRCRGPRTRRRRRRTAYPLPRFSSSIATVVCALGTRTSGAWCGSSGRRRRRRSILFGPPRRPARAGMGRARAPARRWRCRRRVPAGGRDAGRPGRWGQCDAVRATAGASPAIRRHPIRKSGLILNIGNQQNIDIPIDSGSSRRKTETKLGGFIMAEIITSHLPLLIVYTYITNLSGRGCVNSGSEGSGRD